MTFIFPRSHLAGMWLSTAGSLATFGVSAGQCTDDANTVIMNAAAAFTKTTAAWAEGTGLGALLDAGSIHNTTWYNAFAMQRPDTLAVDYGVSTSMTPTLPGSYTTSRYIGGMKTDGSGHWIKFLQNDDDFWWDVPVLDVNSSNPGSAAVLRTLSVPPGKKLVALFNAETVSVSGVANGDTYFSDPDVSDYDVTVQTSAALGSLNNNAVNITQSVECWTNTSSQIRTRAVASGGGTGIVVYTKGWRDRRGKGS